MIHQMMWGLCMRGADSWWRLYRKDAVMCDGWAFCGLRAQNGLRRSRAANPELRTCAGWVQTMANDAAGALAH